jgi:Flp pilus assembly pilin Flp
MSFDGEDKLFFAGGQMNLIRFVEIALVKLANETRGQDLVEYALMAGFVAVAAGAVMPNVSGSTGTIFSQVSSVMAASASQS